MQPNFKMSVVISACATSTMVPGTTEAQLEETLVAAQKREHNLQDVPLSVSVLTSEDLTGQSSTHNSVPGAIAALFEFSRGFCTTVFIIGWPYANWGLHDSPTNLMPRECLLG